MNKIKFYLARIKLITNIIIALIGALLLIFPKNSLATVCIIMGFIVLLKGISKLLTASVISGAFFIGLAILFFIHPDFLISILPFVIGLLIIIYGIYSFKKSRSTAHKILYALTILGGVAIILAPLSFATAVTSIIGAGLLTVGSVSVIIQLKDKEKKSDDVIETDVIDVEDNPEIIDVTDFKDVD